MTYGYDKFLNVVEYNRTEIEQEKEFFAMDEYEKYENIWKFREEMQEPYERKDSLASVFLQLQKSRYWFANRYLTLVLNITDENSEVAEMYNDDGTIYAAGLFINYLSDDDFFKAVTTEENGQIEFKDLKKLINKVKVYRLNFFDDSISEDDKIHSFENMENIFNDIKNGKLKLGKSTSGYGSI